jgi:putative peptidoglycan lipid II flippase
MGYGVGLVGLVAIKVLAPGFYARQDIRTPVRIAIVVLVLSQLMNLGFVPWLGHAGLALSIGVAALINASWLLVGLRRQGVYRPEPGWGRFLLQVMLATALLGGVLAAAAQGLDWTGLRQTPWSRIGWMAACLGGAMLLYVAALAATGLKVRQFTQRA